MGGHDGFRAVLYQCFINLSIGGIPLPGRAVVDGGYHMLVPFIPPVSGPVLQAYGHTVFHLSSDKLPGHLKDRFLVGTEHSRIRNGIVIIRVNIQNRPKVPIGSGCRRLLPTDPPQLIRPSLISGCRDLHLRPE